MAAQPDTDLVTICIDATEGGTLVRVVAPSRHIRMVDLMPVFEALDLNLVSYTAERDPDATGQAPVGGLQAPMARRKHSFRGRFFVTDADGHNLSDAMLDGLVVALQEALHVRLSRPAGRCSALQEDSRRGSVASYATEASIDPESPSSAVAAAHNLPCHLGSGSLAPPHAPSHLHPGNQQPYNPQQPHQQHNPQLQQQPQFLPNHDFAASFHRLLWSEHSVSSTSSLIRAPSGAASDHPTVPSPPTYVDLEGSSFTFLQQQCSETVFSVTSEDRYGGGPATPFAAAAAAAAFHHHHTRSQPPSQPQSQASDMYEMAASVPQRATSASSTPPHTSGSLPLPALNIVPSPGVLQGAGSAAGPGVGAGRAAHMSFFEPPPSTSASTSAIATSATTPLHSRQPSASTSYVAPPGGCLLPASITGRAAGLVDDVATAVATAVASAADGGNDSPTSSSSDDRDGTYTWWSTFSAQDTVARIMSYPARSISAEADLGHAKSLMTKHNISALLVDTGDSSPGFITKRDFLKVQFNKNFKRTKVKDVMTQPVIFVDIALPIEQCSRVLEAHGVRRVLVHDPARTMDSNPLAGFVGVVSDADLFKCMGAPAMSPVVGSMAGSTEQAAAHNPGFGALPTSAFSLPLLPRLPALSLAQEDSNPPSAWGPTTQHVQHPQHPQPHPLSSAASTTSISMSGSAGPSHAASMAVGVSAVDTTAAALAMAGSSCSVMRLNADASLAERYRCAAALWELDFTELEVTRRIGEGSFGEVLLANFRGTKVAVKRLRGFDVGPDNPDTGAPEEAGPSPTQMPIFRQFFEREIEILATIRHPNVVNFIGACHTPPNVCLVTEYCARGSLDHLLHKSSITLDLLKKVEFSMDIARGMSCLHSQKPPIIHRDLKTANLLVSARFEVKVADFGLSRIKDHAQLINSRAGLEGTVEYAAPEVLRGEPYTEKCDIWSYAVLLWEIIHRQRPYADADVPIYILMMSLGNGSLRLPPLREEQATSGLVRLVDRCMAWHPAERPSFREVLHALEAEYKILRGKAAAVPRSDSASSMVLLPGGQNPGSGPGVAQPHPQQQQQRSTLGAGTHATFEHHPLPPHPSGTAAAAGGAHGRPAPQPPHPHQAQRTQHGNPKLGLNPHTPGAEDSGHYAADAASGPFGGHQSPQHQHHQQQQSSRPRVRLAVPAQAGGTLHNSMTTGNTGNADISDPASPADSSSRPSTSRTSGVGAAGASRGAVASGKPGSAGRPTGRSLRSAARSKSMPLPECEWLGAEEGSEEYMDTTESVADDDLASAGTTASGAAAGAQAPHPMSLLSPDRGGVHGTPYPDPGCLRTESVPEDGETELPHHLLVRVLRPSDAAAAADERASGRQRGDVTHGDDGGGGGVRTTSRVQVSAFAAAAQQPQQQRHDGSQQDGAREGEESTWDRPGDTMELSDAPTATSISPAVAPSAPVARRSPFQLAASSPFANAADMPWSPRGSEDHSSPASRFSPPANPEPTASQQQAQPLAVAPAALAPPQRRVAFLSPFAQLANEAPASPSKEEEEEEERRRRQDEEEQQWRLVAAAGGSIAGGNAAAVARPAAAIAASTANSTDVNTLVEKDQRAPLDPSWGLLATCSKPPSGDVYANGSIGRLSPSANAAGPQSQAAAYGQRVAMGGDGGSSGEEEDGDRAAVAENARGPGAEEEEQRQQRLVAVATASTRLEALSLALPSAVAFGCPSMAEASSGSDQFDDDDDADATLHTTAWVRL